MEKQQFIDIHSHYLFGLDDGSRSLEETLGMLEQAASLNIIHLLATPHATELTDDAFSEQVLQRFKEVQNEVKKAGIPVQLSLAAELFFSRRLMDWLHYPWATLANNKKYVLFELPLLDLPDGVGDFIFQCRLKGITPILAHPERYIFLHDKLEKLYAFFQQGCLIQINAGSITGQFGQRVQNVALTFVKGGFVHFVASDAHETKHRNYRTLINAYEELSKFADSSFLNQLFFENPQKAIAGQPIKVQDVDDAIFAKKTDQVKKWAKILKKKFFS
ncbi:hypothetical protein DRI50_04275 [candidate division KSB1 bacterium]|nr:MAG: hypothetical protein DRI50_04275 [candidate division KSB1 bacterium]